jgi:hypothetical protein
MLRGEIEKESYSKKMINKKNKKNSNQDNKNQVCYENKLK